MSVVIPPNHCFHCGLPNTEEDDYPVVINCITHFMCCPGCQAVSQAIVDNGLVNYYEFRTETAEKGDAALDNTMARLAVYDEVELQDEFVFDEGNHKSIQLTVEGITCAACGWLIEKQFAKLSGIKQVSVNVSARRAVITWHNEVIKLSAILSHMQTIGYQALPFQSDNHEASYKKEQKSYLKKLGLAGIMTMQVMMLAMGQYFDIFGNFDEDAVAYFNAVSLLLTTPVVFYAGSIFYLSAFKALMAKTVNMDVPISIAIFATYLAGVLAVNKDLGEVYFESICMFVFFLLISRFLEHRARHKATMISSNLTKLIPITANLQKDNEVHSVLAKQLVTDDVVMVKAGETVPIDGTIITGRSSFDESMLTGEFEPIVKQAGQTIYAGSLNQQDAVSIRVLAPVKYAMMNQILRLQETAMGNKPKMAATADQLSRFFVFAVLLISALTYGVWLTLGNPDAFWITISVLVATCPCALGLATPSALTCAMAKLNSIGILLKRADALEQITKTSDIVFDKTGTLTKGEFSVQKHWFNPKFVKEQALSEPNIEAYIYQLAYAIESRSEHPIAKAFEQHLLALQKDAFNQQHRVQVSKFEVNIGLGVSAVIEGQQYHLGSQAFILPNLATKHNIDSTIDDASISRYQTEYAKQIHDANVLFCKNDLLIAAFWLTDTIQTDASTTIAALKRHTLTILSGDTQANAETVAKALEIDNAVGHSTPQDKLNYMLALQNQDKRVMMLGDGINDAPVLAAADVSIAVGNASDLAKNAADVLLLNAKLSSLVNLINMAKRTKSKIKQNIVWALSYNTLVLPFAVMGLLAPWQAALGMSLSSIIVVYNSTRLMR